MHTVLSYSFLAMLSLERKVKYSGSATFFLNSSRSILPRHSVFGQAFSLGTMEADEVQP